MYVITMVSLVWSRFGLAYRNAISSLYNSRHDHITVRDEQRRLFGGKRSASTSQAPGSSKRKKIHTWTQKFVCLASTSDSKVPSTAGARKVLNDAGLGEKR